MVISNQQNSENGWRGAWTLTSYVPQAGLQAVRRVAAPVLDLVQRATNRNKPMPQTPPKKTFFASLRSLTFRSVLLTLCPVLVAGRAIAQEAGKGLAGPLQTNMKKAADRVAAKVIECVDAYQQLASTASYLATAMAGLYIYHLAVQRKGLQDPICTAQQICGLSIGLVAGAIWLHSVLPPRIERLQKSLKQRLNPEQAR